MIPCCLLKAVSNDLLSFSSLFPNSGRLQKEDKKKKYETESSNKSLDFSRS